ncbi:helix-turn-helix domain-containing protein [Desulfovibrio inopinatus]|uniref:helix-turn-helix domain-containing protein n=1 Tax=Desulfovibrio inopinatus TaxID=102109 RepID=UPI000685B01B|nr:helix-turn-helix transcriptional regulator [Desulfovibrio inopinatus]
MTIGQRFKEIRGKESQDAFAKRLGINKATLGFYERDERTPNAVVLANICSLSGVSSHWLLFGGGPMRRGDEGEALPATTPEELRLDAITPSNEANGGTQNEIHALQKENTELRRECSELRTENQRLNRELSEANKELIQANKEIVQVNKELLQTTKDNADLRVELAEIKTRAAPDTPDEDARLSA